MGRGRPATRRLTWLVRVLLAVGLLVVAAAALFAGRGGALPPKTIGLQDGAAWLVSSAVRQAALVDGASAQIVARVPLGDGTGLAGVQEGADAFVTADDGSVRRVDGATFAVSSPASFATAGQPLAVYPAAETLFAVNRTTGLVTLADAETLATSARFSLSAQVAARGALADGAGRLWVIDGRTGSLLRVDETGRKVYQHAVDPAHTTLVAVEGQPVAVDLTAGVARPIGADGLTGGGACVDSPAGDTTVLLTGASLAAQVYAVSGTRGLLLVSDLATGRCDDAVDLGAAGHRLGQPEEAAGRVFVPDFTTGSVIAVDVATQRVLADVNILPSDTHFVLQRQGSEMFFNDPASSRAGVIHLDGTVTEVQKYDPDQPATGLDTASSTGLTDARGTGSEAAPGPGSPLAAASPSSLPTGQPASPTAEPPPAGPTTPPGAPPPRGPSASSSPHAEPPTLSSAPAPPDQQPATTAPQQQPDQTQARQSQPQTGPRQPRVQVGLSAASTPVEAPITLSVVTTDQPVRTAAWTFGDAGSATGAQVTHAWSAAGTYRITVTGTLADGTSYDVATTVTVTVASQPLDPSTPPSSGNSGTGTGTGTGEGTGDGQNTTGRGSTTGPAGGGTTISPATTNGAGSQPLAVALSVSPSQGAAPLVVTASASGSGGKAPLTYRYDFGDGITGSGTSASHTYQAAGTYTVTLTVTDAAGTTATTSSAVTATGATTAPSAPSNVSARLPSATEIELTWTDNADNETGFRITDGNNIDTPWSAPPNSTSYTVTGLASGAYMCLKVQAYNAAGGSDWVPSGWVCTTTPGEGTNPPSNVVATALDSSSVRVTWTDNSTDEHGFDLSASTGRWDLPANTTSYTITNLAPGTQECVSILAYVQGSLYNRLSSWVSAPCVTTPTSASPSPAAKAVLNMSPVQGTAPLAVTADGSASAGGPGLTCRFNFSDGTSTEQQPCGSAAHTFDAAGSYSVTLTVTDAAGAVDSTTAPVTVTAPATTRTAQATVPATADWLDTGVTVAAGDRVSITYRSGTWWAGPVFDAQGTRYDPPPYDANGIPAQYHYVCAEHLPASQCAEPLPTAEMGALVGRIGGGSVFLVGNSYDEQVSATGSLSLRINDDYSGMADNTGSVTVTIAVTTGG